MVVHATREVQLNHCCTVKDVKYLERDRMHTGSWGAAERHKPVWHFVIKSVLPLRTPILSNEYFTNATHIRLGVKRTTPHLSAFPEQILVVCPFVIRYAFAQLTPRLCRRNKACIA